MKKFRLKLTELELRHIRFCLSSYKPADRNSATIRIMLANARLQKEIAQKYLKDECINNEIDEYIVSGLTELKRYGEDISDLEKEFNMKVD